MHSIEAFLCYQRVLAADAEFRPYKSDDRDAWQLRSKLCESIQQLVWHPAWLEDRHVSPSVRVPCPQSGEACRYLKLEVHVLAHAACWAMLSLSVTWQT